MTLKFILYKLQGWGDLSIMFVGKASGNGGNDEKEDMFLIKENKVAAH